MGIIEIFCPAPRRQGLQVKRSEPVTRRDETQKKEQKASFHFTHPFAKDIKISILRSNTEEFTQIGYHLHRGKCWSLENNSTFFCYHFFSNTQFSHHVKTCFIRFMSMLKKHARASSHLKKNIIWSTYHHHEDLFRTFFWYKDKKKCEIIKRRGTCCTDRTGPSSDRTEWENVLGGGTNRFVGGGWKTILWYAAVLKQIRFFSLAINKFFFCQGLNRTLP